MNSSDLSTPIASGYLDTPTTGSTSGRIIINNVPADADLSNVVIAFMNKSGLAFFCGLCKISMNVPAGTTLSTPLLSIQTENTSYKFEGLDPQSDHAFSVIASANHNYESLFPMRRNYVLSEPPPRLFPTSRLMLESISPPLQVKSVSMLPTIP